MEAHHATYGGSKRQRGVKRPIRLRHQDGSDISANRKKRAMAQRYLPIIARDDVKPEHRERHDHRHGQLEQMKAFQHPKRRQSRREAEHDKKKTCR